MVRIALTDMRATAAQAAQKADETLAQEQAVTAAEIAFAVEHKQTITGHYWQGSYAARLKAQAAHAVADAIAEIMEEAHG